MIHRALADAVAWKYIADNPANNIKPPKRPRKRRTVWKPDQIHTFLMSVQQDRFAAPRYRRDHHPRQPRGRRRPRESQGRRQDP